jgi:hypothetical protein
LCRVTNSWVANKTNLPSGAEERERLPSTLRRASAGQPLVVRRVVSGFPMVMAESARPLVEGRDTGGTGRQATGKQGRHQGGKAPNRETMESGFRVHIIVLVLGVCFLVRVLMRPGVCTGHLEDQGGYNPRFVNLGQHVCLYNHRERHPVLGPAGPVGRAW